MLPSKPCEPEILQPEFDCRLCPRLGGFRDDNRTQYPEFHNAPVSSFGDRGARLLIVGLAPGLKGANRTGRPFTGDYAGDLLYRTLIDHGFAKGRYGRRADDGLRLVDCRVTNAVRCVPPANKPTGGEIRTCRRFLESEIAAMPHLKAMLALGAVAHGAVLASLGLVRSRYPFAHGAMHELPSGRLLADSYHCSRYNTNTGRLTEAMFHQVFEDLGRRLG
jgi:uracil-DNA glycosylase